MLRTLLFSEMNTISTQIFQPQVYKL
uniref:Uncharacterized protein n=1 Tax=Anguilla anguilla TaxID=7936 RepID=A0A0E9WKA3_ANGAN